MRRLPIAPPERGQRGKGAHRVLAGRNHPTRVTGQSKCVPPKMKEYYSTGGIADSLPRRACAGAALSTHGADKDAQSQDINVVSGVLTEHCTIHMGSPPDPRRTASRLPPYRLACCLGDSWESHRTIAVENFEPIGGEGWTSH